MSYNQSPNAWYLIPWIDKTHGVHGSTPADPTHYFNLGVMPYLVKIHQASMTPSMLASVDQIVDACCITNKSGEKSKVFPMAHAKGITNLTMNTADEWVGVLFTYLIVARLPRGQEAMRNSFERNKKKATQDNNDKKVTVNKDKESIEEMPDEPITIEDFVEVAERLLIFHEWMKRSQPIKWSDNLQSKYDKEVRELVDLVKDKFPRKAGLGWDIQKIHEMMGVVDDVRRFGCTSNYDAAIGEMLLQTFIKLPGSTARHSSHDDFIMSLAVRECERDVLQQAIRCLESQGTFLPLYGRNRATEDNQDNIATNEDHLLPPSLADVGDYACQDDIDEDCPSSNSTTNKDENPPRESIDGIRASYKKCNVNWDWQIHFDGTEGEISVMQYKKSRKKTKPQLHPVIIKQLKKTYSRSKCTVYGSYSFEKTWVGHDGVNHRVVFRCDPDF